MTETSADDIDRLRRYLGSSRFRYIDFQQAEAVVAALQRWPLLRRLLESPGTSGATPSER